MMAIDDLSVDDIDFPTDTIPELDVIEYPCTECGKEAGPYSGRGRKPTKCPEHKATPAKSGTRKTTGKNAQIAGQAADALAQYNDLAAFIAIICQYDGTGSAIQNANDAFREKAYQALLTDPALAQRIASQGVISGKVSLIIAYALLAGSVVPVALLEMAEHKRERELRLAEEG